jgi:hypothetical protein
LARIDRKESEFHARRHAMNTPPGYRFAGGRTVVAPPRGPGG